MEILELKNIEEHFTKDADVTFKHKNKYYAIEIETGTLLKNPRQLAEKVQYLNIKYKDRWMFLVTNKNLLSKYKKYGLTTQRITFEKVLRLKIFGSQKFWFLWKLEKTDKNRHPKKLSVNTLSSRTKR